MLHGPGIGADAGRRYLTATVTDNTFSWQQSYLTAWSAAFLAITNGNGNSANLATDPSLPPAVTIGSGFSANGGFRMPWNSGADSPQGFVDPAELAVTLGGNTALIVPASGVPTPVAGEAGQVYAGTIDGAAYGEPLPVETAAVVPAGDPSPYAPLNASNLAIGQVEVDLASSFTTVGIGVDGDAGSGNLDGHGNSYSASALGPSLAWDGATFALGPADADDVISAAGQTIALPAGRFDTIALLGASVFGPQTGTFVVTYTDGTTASFSLTLSDWTGGDTGPGTTAPGESIAAITPYTDQAAGTYRQPAYVYGYTLPVAQGKALKSITLPSNSKIKILAMDLI